MPEEEGNEQIEQNEPEEPQAQQEEAAPPAEAQAETPAEPAPAVEVQPEMPAEAAKPRKKVPQIPKGKFKKREKADLVGAKGKFAAPKEGPVKKQSLDRFAKKSRINKKILLAIVIVVAVLVVAYLFVGAGTSVKTHAVYLNARNTIENNKTIMPELGGTVLNDGRFPKLTKSEENGRRIVEIENSISGEKKSGTFKAKAVFYRRAWQILYLEVTVDGKVFPPLINKEVTDKGLQKKG